MNVIILFSILGWPWCSTFLSGSCDPSERTQSFRRSSTKATCFSRGQVGVYRTWKTPFIFVLIYCFFFSQTAKPHRYTRTPTNKIIVRVFLLTLSKFVQLNMIITDTHVCVCVTVSAKKTVYFIMYVICGQWSSLCFPSPSVLFALTINMSGSQVYTSQAASCLI